MVPGLRSSRSSAAAAASIVSHRLRCASLLPAGNIYGTTEFIRMYVPASAVPAINTTGLDGVSDRSLQNSIHTPSVQKRTSRFDRARILMCDKICFDFPILPLQPSIFQSTGTESLIANTPAGDSLPPPAILYHRRRFFTAAAADSLEPSDDFGGSSCRHPFRNPLPRRSNLFHPRF
ncbi:unnamed protein product [Cuscuta campestris]|uniref:Uncharacterized protein n=1 Tax=Cuscuta campestris TaxID=132261 RepID=A0A484KJZ1_9ASTE|nr:unnamed protein product [Cuscuta campestris]